MKCICNHETNSRIPREGCPVHDSAVSAGFIASGDHNGDMPKEMVSYSVKPIVLTSDQIFIVIQNMAASWSPIGLAKKYDADGLQKLADIFTEAARIAKQ